MRDFLPPYLWARFMPPNNGNLLPYERPPMILSGPFAVPAAPRRAALSTLYSHTPTRSTLARYRHFRDRYEFQCHGKSSSHSKTFKATAQTFVPAALFRGSPADNWENPGNLERQCRFASLGSVLMEAPGQKIFIRTKSKVEFGSVTYIKLRAGFHVH